MTVEELAAARAQDAQKQRSDSERGMSVELEKTWPVAARKSLVDAGYTIAESAHAVVSAVWNDGGAMR